MARPRKTPLLDESETEMPIEEQGDYVTYLPRDAGDPPKVTWCGLVFHAHVPKFIDDPDHVERARGNKHFRVGEFKPEDALVEIEQDSLPKIPDQYRAHAIEWAKRVQSVEELDRKWAGEETLRIDCGVGSDDLEYLNGIFAPIRAELRKRDMAG